MLGTFRPGSAWFPTPTAAALDTVRPSARNCRPRNHAKRCEQVGIEGRPLRIREVGWARSPRERDVWPTSRPVARLGHQLPQRENAPTFATWGVGAEPRGETLPDRFEVAAIGLLEPGLFALGPDLSQDCAVERSVRRLPAGARP